MSSEMRELIEAKIREWSAKTPDYARRNLERERCADELRALLARQATEVASAEAGAEHGVADHGMERAARELLVPCDCGCGRSCCAYCGTDIGFVRDAAPVADGLYAWVRESPRHWERVTESDLSQPADPQKMRAGGWFPVYTHPHDASAREAWDSVARVEESIKEFMDADVMPEWVTIEYWMVLLAQARSAALPSPPKEKES